MITTLFGMAAAGVVRAAGLTMTMWQTPPINTGTEYSFGVNFTKTDRNDGIVRAAPFTLHIQLPAA